MVLSLYLRSGQKTLGRQIAEEGVEEVINMILSGYVAK